MPDLINVIVFEIIQNETRNITIFYLLIVTVPAGGLAPPGTKWHCSMFPYTAQCRYNAVCVLKYTPPPPPPPHMSSVWARYGWSVFVSFVHPASDWFSARVSAIIYAIYYYIGPRYNGTALYFSCRLQYTIWLASNDHVYGKVRNISLKVYLKFKIHYNVHLKMDNAGNFVQATMS